MTENIEEELAEKLATLFERDRSGGGGKSLPITPSNEASIPADFVTSAKHAQEGLHPQNQGGQHGHGADHHLDIIQDVQTRVLGVISLYLKNTFFIDSNPPFEQDDDSWCWVLALMDSSEP